MEKTYWITWGTITAALLVFTFWCFPLWMATALISLIIIPAVKRGKKKVALEAQIELLAKQAGIQYGTTKEKLEQIATGRAKATYDNRDPWDRA